MPISPRCLRTLRLPRPIPGNHHTRINPMPWLLFLCLAVIQFSLTQAAAAQSAENTQETDQAATGKASLTPQVTYPVGTIFTVAGSGAYSYGGDGSKATVAPLRQPLGAATYGGNFYIADYGNDIIREVTTSSGIINTIAGTPVAAGYKGDGGAATSALLNNPRAITLDGLGNQYIADSANNVIRKVDSTTKIITTIAGTGTAGYNGDGGAATSALLKYPVGLCFDATYSNLYVSDQQNNVIRVINIASGTINTFAGTGSPSYSGDGGPASLATLNQPNQIFMDAAGSLYIADGNNYAVRKVDASTGNISTIAGTGVYSYAYQGDGTLATLVPLRNPFGIVVDSAGNVFFSDSGIHVVFEIQAANKEMKLVAGKVFTANFSGDGGQATSAILSSPAGLALDSSGNGYIADSGNERVREIVGMAMVTGVTTAPTFSPAAGTYTSTISVTLADATPKAVIYYTTDGTTPTTSSPQYGGVIPITETTTIKAMAEAPGDTASSVVSSLFTIQVATPTFSPAAGTYTSPHTVTISDATSGATIYYTTDGSTPTTSSTKYTGPITVSTTQTIIAIAAETGDTTSAVASGAYTINLATVVATPTISPAGGTYNSAQTVTISDTTSGATIYYTTDGSTPTTSSAKYTGPITVSATETIKAIGSATGDTNSAVATATYTIIPNPVTIPVFSPVSGTYPAPVSVTISDATSGATIYYTINGSTPTTSSTKYAGPIAVNSTETLKAIAVTSGGTNSTVATAAYTIQAATPVISVVSGTYTSAQKVTISDTTTGATIYYTLDGSTPTTSSTKYAGTITISSSETLKAIATATGYGNSTVASAAYTINLPPAATPTFSPVAGTYTSVQTVTIADATTGASIYYTTDGSTPTTSSTRYAGAITVSSTETLKAIAAAASYSNSAVASAAYTINLPPAATPTFSPAAGTYTSVQTVTIADATTGASIYYTTDGSTPTTSSPKYTTPITVNSTETIKAIATATSYSNSTVASAGYTINLPPAATPTFSPAAGIYTSVQTVTISDTTAGVSIYYTTDGSTPTTSSTRYAGAITVSSTETIKAIAAAASYSNSVVASAAYTINLPTVATPIFSPASGTFTSAQSVTISETTSGATIYYTTDGSTPTTSSTKYTVAIAVSATETIKAIATASGYVASGIGSATYTITAPPVVVTPTFSPAAGTYTSVQSVTISDTTSGATIYYTTDGTTPTNASTMYTAPIAVSATETINAIATASGYSPSGVATAAYTINLPVASFTLAASPSSASISSGQSAQFTLTVTPQNGFTQSVAFSCSGLPSGDTCSFSPATVTPSGAPVTSALTIASGTSAAMNQSLPLWAKITSGVSMALLLWPIRKRRAWAAFVLAVLFGAGFVMVGCGGSSSPKSQNYTVTVTATGGSVTQTTNLALTVKN